jgi:modulator of FtsH protease HflC
MAMNQGNTSSSKTEDKQQFNLAWIAFSCAMLIIVSCLYLVQEGQRAIVIRLGEIVSQNKVGTSYQPGLHLKIPFIDQVRKFDTRLQSFDEKSSRILTVEQKYVLVDYYVKWRIENVSLYYKRTGGYPQVAERLLKQKTNDALRAAFGKRSISDVISGERVDIIKLLRERASKHASKLGIHINDVRIKRIDLPREVSMSVFERMRADRQRVATMHRSDGLAAGERVQANADAQVIVTLATARAQANKFRAEGQAKAAKIYNDAYMKDAKFYALYRSLQAYETSFSKRNDLLILQPNTEYFKYFHKTPNGE